MKFHIISNTLLVEYKQAENTLFHYKSYKNNKNRTLFFIITSIICWAGESKDGNSDVIPLHGRHIKKHTKSPTYPTYSISD